MNAPRLRQWPIAFLTAATVMTLWFERDAILNLLSAALHVGIEVQRDFNRTLAHRLRETNDGKSPDALLIALGLAFTYGIVHALGPGHGKFVVVTYFLAHRRRIWRGFLMGSQIAVMHVISAIVIVLIAHYLSQRFWGPTGDMPGLRIASYASIALVGLYMLRRALRNRAGPGLAHDCCFHATDLKHSHEDGRSQRFLSLGVGIAPCSGAVLLLIFAFANDLVWIGILMTAAIAAGMAVTMIGLGLLSIFARSMVAQRLDRTGRTSPRIGGLIELGGAVFIIFFGVLMTAVSILQLA